MAAEVLVSQGWVRTEIAMLVSDSKGNTIWRNFVSYKDIRKKIHTHIHLSLHISFNIVTV